MKTIQLHGFFVSLSIVFFGNLLFFAEKRNGCRGAFNKFDFVKLFLDYEFNAKENGHT